MYITNDVNIAQIAQRAGVDRIWIDLEKLGKEERQKGDTVKSDHSIQDIKRIKPYLGKSKLQVRINPLNPNSVEEIEKVIEYGADIVMLPYYKTIHEVTNFLEIINERVKTCLLLETKEAHDCLRDTLEINAINEIYIGLNDLHLSYNKKFMFELLTDGTVSDITAKIKRKKLPYGFGGVARIGEGLLPAEMILAEHYRLGSTRVILSRSFCNTNDYLKAPDLFEKDFTENVLKIRMFEEYLQKQDSNYFLNNYELVRGKINYILENKF